MAIFLAVVGWILISVLVGIVAETVITFGSSGLPRRRPPLFYNGRTIRRWPRLS
jgi:hypothetical protein